MTNPTGPTHTCEPAATRPTRSKVGDYAFYIAIILAIAWVAVDDLLLSRLIMNTMVAAMTISIYHDTSRILHWDKSPEQPTA